MSVLHSKKHHCNLGLRGSLASMPAHVDHAYTVQLAGGPSKKYKLRKLPN